MADAFDDRLDRYVAGELSARDERRLAQAALDDPALFDRLTAAALVREAARGEAPTSGSHPAVRPTRRIVWLAAAGAAMAAAAAIAVIVIRRPPPISTPAPTPAAVAETPRPASRAPEQLQPPPIFLTARADETDRPSTFRSTEAGSRPPNERGTVSSVDGDDVEITLGSLDGLAKGSSVRSVPQDGRGPTTTLTVDAVFRERSRGRLQSGPAPRIGDRTEVSPADHVSALLQHAAAREAAGDITSAVRHLRAAADALDRAPAVKDAQRAEVLNALGSALIDQRAYDDAEPILRTARSYATGRAAVRITNNLGAIAAIHGDRAAAEALYQSALRLAGDSADGDSDRRAIRKNLDALQSAR